jgi:ribosome recycling factor
MSMEEIEFECESEMERAVEYFRNELRTVRTGRATAGLVDHLKIEVPSYGSTMDLRELASFSIPDPTCILVKPFDPSILKDIERGIRNSNIGISPVQEGKMLRLAIPPLSGERRQQIISQLKKMAETQRIAVRNARRDANKQADAEQKDGTLTEDEAKKCKENIQELTNKYQEQIDRALEAKTKEIETV